MTHKYDWDGIRVRFARGETAHSISKSLGGSPTRQGIRKKAKRENWLEGNSTIPDYVRNLPLLQSKSKVPRKRSPEAVNAILGFIERGATEEQAARATGISPRTLYNWKLECPEFAALIEVARARKEVEWVDNIDKAGKKDWKASDRLLQVSPGTKEMWGRQSKQESPQIILNIHRDEVTVEGNIIESVAEEKHEEPLPELPTLEPDEVLEPEAQQSKQCWQGDNISERKALSEQQALEQRVMGLDNK